MAAVCFGECCYRVPGKYLGGLLYKEVLLGWNCSNRNHLRLYNFSG